MSVLTKIKGLNPDALLVAARTGSGAVIMKQYTELGMKMLVFNQGEMVNEQFVKLVGKEIAQGLIIDPPQDAGKQPSGQMALGQQEPVVP